MANLAGGRQEKMMRILFQLIVVTTLSGCLDLVPVPTAAPVGPAPVETRRQAVDFGAVVQRVEPVSEQICRARTTGINCDFRIFVDTRPGLPPNAYQSVDDRGRPVLGITQALITQVFNNDELAFILSHEAAHHIAGHLPKTRDTALAGAVLGGLLATLAGGTAADVDKAQNFGGTVGARTYSKGFELEADRLGTVIAFRAGYDPLAGAQYFARIPDPGDQFLGTHPPNGARITAVRQTMAGLN